MSHVFVLVGLKKNISIDYFDPEYLHKKHEQHEAIVKRGAKITQEAAHEIFEGVETEVEVRYGVLISSMYLTAFFASIFPLAQIINIILLAVRYWIDKYIFYRRAALPNYLGPKIQKTMIPQLEYIIWAYYAGNVYIGILFAL